MIVESYELIFNVIKAFILESNLVDGSKSV